MDKIKPKNMMAEHPWQRYSLTDMEKKELLNNVELRINNIKTERNTVQEKLDNSGTDGHKYFNSLKPYYKEIRHLETCLEFILSGVEFRVATFLEDAFEVRNLSQPWKIFVYCETGSWRVKGKNKWYRSKSTKNFIEKYVIGGVND